jgi:hypothetical protein
MSIESDRTIWTQQTRPTSLEPPSYILGHRSAPHGLPVDVPLLPNLWVRGIECTVVCQVPTCALVHSSRPFTAASKLLLVCTTDPVRTPPRAHHRRIPLGSVFPNFCLDPNPICAALTNPNDTYGSGKSCCPQGRRHFSMGGARCESHETHLHTDLEQHSLGDRINAGNGGGGGEILLLVAIMLAITTFFIVIGQLHWNWRIDIIATIV